MPAKNPWPASSALARRQPGEQGGPGASLMQAAGLRSRLAASGRGVREAGSGMQFAAPVYYAAKRFDEPEEAHRKEKKWRRDGNGKRARRQGNGLTKRENAEPEGITADATWTGVRLSGAESGRECDGPEAAWPAMVRSCTWPADRPGGLAAGEACAVGAGRAA